MILETGNSRMKDFFDLYWLSRNMDFDGTRLRDSIVATFDRRGTDIPEEEVIALTEVFSCRSDKQMQWKAFTRKSNLPEVDLKDVVQQIADFLNPVLYSNIAGQVWDPVVGWKLNAS